MTPAGLTPISSQKTAQHPRPREGKLKMQPVDLAHEFEIGRQHRARQVIFRASREARGAPFELRLAGRNLIQVNVELIRELRNRPFGLDRRQRHLRLEGR